QAALAGLAGQVAAPGQGRQAAAAGGVQGGAGRRERAVGVDADHDAVGIGADRVGGVELEFEGHVRFPYNPFRVRVRNCPAGQPVRPGILASPPYRGPSERMRLIERYLAREFAASVAAVAVVLLLVGLGGLLVDLMSEIARGKVPAGLLLSQLGLRSIQALPVLLPLALFVGLLLSIGRMYGESEMAVLAAVGLGPQSLWRPLAVVVLPVAAIVAASSLWAAPLGARIARDMVDTANRSFLVAGLEAGRFRELPGRGGIIYVGELSVDGTRFRRLFVQTERDGRLDVITATDGEMFFEGEVERYLLLRDGFRVEGAPGQLD